MEQGGGDVECNQLRRREDDQDDDHDYGGGDDDVGGGGGDDVAILSLQVKSFVTFLESRRGGGSGRLFSTVHCGEGWWWWLLCTVNGYCCICLMYCSTRYWCVATGNTTTGTHANIQT